MRLHPLTEQLLETPPVEWDTFLSALNMGDRQTIENQLHELAQASTRLARYVYVRNSGRDHKTAVKETNKAGAGVRKALRYTYPESANFTF